MKKLRSTLALLLVLVMCLSLFPASAYAEDEIAEDETVLAGDGAPGVPEDGALDATEDILGSDNVPDTQQDDTTDYITSSGEPAFFWTESMLTKTSASGAGPHKLDGGQRDFKWPVPASNKISSCFLDPEAIPDDRSTYHYAIDINYDGYTHTPIVASYDGVVLAVNNDGYGGGFGNYVVLKHNYRLGTGQTITLYSRYSHLYSTSVSTGQSVNKGTQVGTMGNSGGVYQIHLDFQILYGCSDNTWGNYMTYSIDPFVNDLLELPSGFNGSGATTACCWNYVTYVKELYNTPVQTSYLSYCTPYHTYGTVKIAQACNPYTLPCNSDTAQSYGATSTALTDKSLKVNDVVTVIGIVYNTENHYWYKVNLAGTIAYVYAAKTDVSSFTYCGPWVDGNNFPNSISGAYPLSGTITTSGTAYGGSILKSIQGYVLNGNTTDLSNATSVYNSSPISASGTSYQLAGSAVDNGLAFQNLTAGRYYTLVFVVKEKCYRLTSTTSISSEETKSYTIRYKYFYFGSGTPTTCTVSFNANGGTCSTGSISYNQGASLGDLPEPTPPNTLAPYRFDGWYTAMSGGTKVESSTVVNSSMTLYAHWIHDPFYSKITFVLNGGSFARLNGESATTYTAKDYETGQTSTYNCYAAYLADNKYIYTAGMGDYYHELPVPTKDGAYFAGWYTDSSFGYSQKADWDKGYSGSTLYAKWVDASNAYATASTTYNGHVYEVFDYNMTWTAAKAFCQARGGHLVSITSAEEQNTVVSLITGSGDLNGSLNGQYYIGATDTETDTIWKWVTGEAVSYSNWDTDAPEPNGGTSENYATIISKQNPPNKQTGEWVDVPNLHFGDYYSVSNTGFVCEYDNREYTVSYDANGGTGAPAPQIKTHGTPLTLSSVTPTRANSSAGSYTVTLNANGGSVSQSSLTAARTTSYSFRNWNTAANGSGTSYSPGASYTANADAMLYAQWNSSTATASVSLPTPTREGYIFRGWATNSTATSGVTGSYTPGGSVTLYAIWEAAVAYGVWGELNWVIDSGGTLTISGSGPMDNNAYLGSNNWTDHKTKFSKVVIEEGVTSVGNFAFTMGTNVRQVTLPDSLTRIGTTAFALCKNLTEIVIPPHVTSIGDAALGGCGLTQITIPASVTVLGEQVFASANLTSVSFEGHAPEIGNNCFKDTEATVYFPANDASWTQSARQDYGGALNWVIRTADGHSYGEPSWSWTEGYGAASASFRCLENNSTQTLTASVTSARVEATQTKPAKLVYTARVVFLQAEYTDTKEVLLGYNTTLTLPSSTVRIESEAFAGLTQGVNVVIPDSVQFIASDAFRKNRVVIIAEAGSYAAWWAEYNSVPCIING